MNDLDPTLTSVPLEELPPLPTNLRSIPVIWRTWWKGLTLKQRLLPSALLGLYALALMLVDGFRNDHALVIGVLSSLAYSGPWGRQFLKFAIPFFLTAIIYDSQRFFADSIRGFVHVNDPYLFDKTFFGIQTQSGILTPNEWWQLHLHPVLDLITGFAYLVFFMVFILIAVYFTYVLKNPRARRMPWAFFWLNMLGYSTYYWYAAAPPWYVTLYGLGEANMQALPNSAGCVRFDEILGTHFFSEMYGRSADVFGAIPSLHVAYPLLAVLYSFQLGTARVFSILFYLIMCFSAVYLNHHYVLDILWGSAYAVLMWLLVDLALDKPWKRASEGPSQAELLRPS